MATYLSSVNNVLSMLRWGELTSGEFASPPAGHPGAVVKTLYNKSKNQVLNRIGYPLIEQEFFFNTTAAVDETTHTGASFTTGAAFAEGKFLVTGGPTFDSTYVDRKLTFSQGSATTATNVSGAWERIIAIPASNQIQVQTAYNGGVVFESATESWSIYKDEYDLDASARQITSAWTGDGSLALKFVDEDAEIDHIYAGVADVSSPREMAIFRSSTTAKIWQCQLYPAPRLAHGIHYKATTFLADLVNATDVIELEPEVISMIEDATIQRALTLPIQADPQSAVLVREMLNDDMDEWSEANTPPAPRRRRRRIGPDESPTRRSNTRRIVVD